MDLNGRQIRALQKIVFESAFLEGDFAHKGKFGGNIGDVTINSLIDLGLIESGPSDRHHGSVGYRPTDLGKEVEEKTW